MSRFYFALKEDGVLVLGKAEMTTGYGRAFVPVDVKRRVFSRGNRHETRDRLIPAARSGDHDAVGEVNNHARLREMTFEASSVAQIMVDRVGVLILANARARELFGIQQSDLGRPLQELDLSWKPVQLQVLLDQAVRDQRQVKLNGIPWQTLGDQMYLDVVITPLLENGTRLLGAGVHFFDVTREKMLRNEVEQTNQELETAIEELHSTNEELETTNEELQSTNEELSATNDELRTRTSEVNRLNRFLETLMASVRASVMVLDQSLRVQLWNRQSYEMWGLPAAEVAGTPFLGADIGLPRDTQAPALMSCLRGRSDMQEFEIDAVNRRGRTIRCRVTITPMGQTDRLRPEPFL